ncbi:Inositol-pentakisphosphate 2-kinase [Colletotrichum trifolii]|uniref:Inositol-pentakisphosphate 2-kinase n=1 Tax=Colletotrichum trifolii TaxID=5466 RepID=A0A4R8RMA9_COLTR|nr:Inositol-pentakisphosphate 2-kinase [Colletotrichum trifolii]
MASQASDLEELHISHVAYMGEGAANVVFQATNYTPNGTLHKFDNAEAWNHYLIRVPKQPKDPKKGFYSTGQHLRYFAEEILPLFRHDRTLFVDQLAIRLPRATIAEMRATLAAMDAMPPQLRRRPAKFHGDTVDPKDNCVMLVEDMTSKLNVEFKQTTIEFKPKWLTQSPSAPQNANTCRCCALAAKKYADSKAETPNSQSIKATAGAPQKSPNEARVAKKPAKDDIQSAAQSGLRHTKSDDDKRKGAEISVKDKTKDVEKSPKSKNAEPLAKNPASIAKEEVKIKNSHLSPDNYACPLWLDPEQPTSAGKEKIRQMAIEQIFKGDKHHAALYNILKEKPTLVRLRDVQMLLDKKGPLEASRTDDKFCMAMTLRDCSLFVRYREDSQGRVDAKTLEAKLADLDKKNAAWKFDEWVKKERDLIEGGWYTGRGNMKNCRLQP